MNTSSGTTPAGDPGRLARELAERRKELAALFRVTDLLRCDRRTIPGLLADIANVLPPAFQFPEVTAARVEFDGGAGESPGFRSTTGTLTARFATADGREGAIHVTYLKERPPADEGPFLEEERQLVDNIAAMLRGHLDRLAVETSLRAAQERLRLILDSAGEGIHGLDAEGRIVFENPAAEAAFGWSPGELIGRFAHETIHHHHADGRAYAPDDCPIHRTLQDGVARRVSDEVFFRRDGIAFPVEYVCSPVKDEHGGVVGAVVSFRDISARRRAEQVQSFDAGIMEAISSGTAAGEVLLAIVEGVERLEEGGVASILRFDAVAGRLRGGAAPSLPDFYQEATDGLSVGPEACSCGTAAYRGQPVYVADILEDPLWAAYRPAARSLHKQSGLRACWSTPVLDRDGRVQATFSIYHREARQPRPEEVNLIDHAVHLVRLLFDRDRREEILRESEARLAVRARQQEALARLSTDALRATDLRAALQHATEAVAEVFAVRFANVLEISEDKAGFRLIAGVGWQPGVVGGATAAEGAQSQAGYTLGAGEAVCVEDFARETRFEVPSMLRRHGIVSSLSVAVEAENRPWGVLGVHTEARRNFAAEEREFLQTVSHLLSIIVGRFAAQQRLEASERSLRSTFEEAAAGIAVTSLDGRFLEANAAYCRMLQYNEAELRQLDILAVTHPDDRESNRALLAKLVGGTRNSFTLEKRYLAKSGREIWVRISVAAQRDKQGRPVRLIGIAEDVTVEKQAGIELRRVAERLETTLASITDAFFTIDRDWRFTYLNAEAERVLHRGKGELLGRTIWEEFPAAIGTTFEHEYRRACEGNITVGFEEYYPPLETWFEVRAYPSPEGLAVYFRDVTQRRADREALRLSEERFREMAENIDHVFFNYDPVEKRLLYANHVYEKLFGRPLSVAYADPLDYLNRLHPADRPLAEDAFARQLAGETTEIDFRVIRPDSSTVWVRERAVPVRDASGRVERIVGTMTDITGRKVAENRISESEEKFRLLARVTNDAVWDWDLVTDTVEWNEGFEALSGFRRDEIPPASEFWVAGIHPDDRDRVARGIHRVIHDGGSEWADQYRFRRKDDTYVYVMDRGYVLRNESGRGVRMLGGMTDLTDRLRIAERLMDQALLIDQASDAIVVRDLDGRIVLWSHGAERVYGWSAEEVRGRIAADILQTDAAARGAVLPQVMETGEWSGELRHRRKDGTEITVFSRWTLMRDGERRPKSILSINTDVTERRQIEQQLLRTQRMESIGTLAGGIAHDLNNLLSPITMGVDLLKRFEPKPESLRVIANIETNARRGALLVRQVMSYARGVEGERVAVRLEEIAREVQGIAESTFPKSIDFAVDASDDLVAVSGDSTQLNQILLNLCVNARDAMPHGGRITVRLRNVDVDLPFAAMNREARPGRYVVATVEDSGTGITKEHLEKIFDPFFTTKELGQGTGLGLSTVQGIVRSHGGFIRVFSEPGKGSRFEVFLPARDSSLEQAASAAVVDVTGSGTRGGNGECILVVDDEAPILRVVRQTLESFDYEVLTAEDGAKAIDVFVANRERIAVVVTDVMMPVMDGAVLVSALRRLDPDVRVIAATGLDAQTNLTRLAREGVHQVLTKPYTAETLLSAVARELAPKG
jgi:PAS domain S-box-containing protein